MCLILFIFIYFVFFYCFNKLQHTVLAAFTYFYLQKDNNYHPYPLDQVRHISYQLTKSVKCKLLMRLIFYVYIEVTELVNSTCWFPRNNFAVTFSYNNYLILLFLICSFT